MSKKLLASLTLCLSLLGAAGPVLAQANENTREDVLSRLEREGWKVVQDGVLRRELRADETETFVYGAEGFTWKLQDLRRQLQKLRAAFEASPTPELRKAIANHRQEIARTVEMIELARITEASGETGIAKITCTPSYTYDADAGPRTDTQGTWASASASFIVPPECGLSGEVYTYAFARTLLNGAFTTDTVTDGPRSGANVSATAYATRTGGSPCESYAYVSVTSSSTSYSKDKQNNSCNRKPVANNDSATTDRNVAVDINVLANDSDPDGNPISVYDWTQPAHGSVAKNANGTLRYTPTTSYSGPDSFTYRISDGKDLSNSAAVSITVRIPNNAPDARDDGWYNYPGLESQIPYSNLLTNDYDPDGDTLTVTGVNAAGLTGTLDCSSGFKCVYTSPSWFRGTTSFTYTVSDGKGGTDPATVRIKVGVTNNAPAPQDDLLETAYNTPLTFTRAALLLNDSDADGDVLSVTQVFQWPFSGVSCSAANYTCTYTPPADFTGVQYINYQVTDGVDYSSAKVRILVRPPSPAVLDAREDQRFVNTATSYLSYTWMTSNDYDPEGGSLTVVNIDTTGLQGTLDCTLDPNGCEFRRTTASPTRFRYTVRDPQGNLATTTVTLQSGTNQAPVVANDQLSTRMNTPLTFSIFDVLKNDYDPDNDQLDVLFNFASQFGRVVCSTPYAYFCTYTPNANFTGTDTLTYQANDKALATQGTVTVTVNP
ncbi:MAG TPA: Ig-like domain-containing protein [Thermoanaerobaculia bacterium]